MSSSENRTKTSQSDKWGAASAVYATAATVVTRPPSEELVSWVDSISPFSRPKANVFDNGCGTGVVTTALSARFPNIPILAGDLSPGMVDMVEKKGMPNVRTQLLDAVNLSPLENDTFTHVLSTFMVQFTPSPLQSLKEMHRVTKVGGTFGLAVWGNTITYEPWIDACKHFEPNYEYPHTWAPDWEQETNLQAYIHEAGFENIQMKTLKPKYNFRESADFCDFFLGSKNPEFERAIQPWKDSGRYDEVEAVFKRVVEEEYNGARDFDMKALLFVARK